MRHLRLGTPSPRAPVTTATEDGKSAPRLEARAIDEATPTTVVMGHSMGALTAIRLCLDLDPATTSLVLIAPAVVVPPLPSPPVPSPPVPSASPQRERSGASLGGAVGSAWCGLRRWVLAGLLRVFGASLILPLHMLAYSADFWRKGGCVWGGGGGAAHVGLVRTCATTKTVPPHPAFARATQLRNDPHLSRPARSPPLPRLSPARWRWGHRYQASARRCTGPPRWTARLWTATAGRV